MAAAAPTSPFPEPSPIRISAPVPAPVPNPVLVGACTQQSTPGSGVHGLKDSVSATDSDRARSLSGGFVNHVQGQCFVSRTAGAQLQASARRPRIQRASDSSFWQPPRNGSHQPAYKIALESLTMAQPSRPAQRAIASTTQLRTSRSRRPRGAASSKNGFLNRVGKGPRGGVGRKGGRGSCAVLNVDVESGADVGEFPPGPAEEGAVLIF
eukprot:4094227-Pleurochrysis_carterae.AAC.2